MTRQTGSRSESPTTTNSASETPASHGYPTVEISPSENDDSEFDDSHNISRARRRNIATIEFVNNLKALLEEANQNRDSDMSKKDSGDMLLDLPGYVKKNPKSGRTVKIMFAFLSIFDIETKRQQFTTEVVLQARWSEPSLKRKEAAHGTIWREKFPSHLWEPRLRLKNLEEVKRGRDDRWYTVNWPPGQDAAEIVFRRKVRGAFYQKMELQHFPVDVQAISVQVSTDYDKTEITLKEDDQNCSIIFCEAFRNDQEWKMFEHVP